MIISKSFFLKLRICDDNWLKSIETICIFAWCIKQNSCLFNSVIPILAHKNCDLNCNFSENILGNDLLQYKYKFLYTLILDSLIISKFCKLNIDKKNAKVDKDAEVNKDIEVDEDMKVDENIEVDNNIKVNENKDAEVDKYVEINKDMEVNENTKVDEDMKNAKVNKYGSKW